MLYQSETQTLIEVITVGVTPEGEALSTEHLEWLQTLKGSTTENGGFVAQVALVFIMGPMDADPWMDDIERLGLECRVMDPVTASEKTLHRGVVIREKATLPEPPSSSSGQAVRSRSGVGVAVLLICAALVTALLAAALI